MALEEYRKKRDFFKTKEPEGKDRGKASSIFVVQKHKARTLHYDFRLEIGGVLKSWAVPKGVSTDPSVKRLAVETEDHPLEYADFEGKIPEGEYGAGTVEIWDKGTYRPIKEKPIQQSYDDGLMEFMLHGKKLEAGYALIRTQKKQWLLKRLKEV